jgi:Flp pilus assembly protein TadD
MFVLNTDSDIRRRSAPKAFRTNNLWLRSCCAALCLSFLSGCVGGASSLSDFRLGRRQEFKDPGRVHLAFAKLSEKTGDLKVARDSFQIVLDEDPQSVEATVGLAGLDLREGKTRDAERGFLKATQLAPGDPLVTEALGQFYLAQDRFRDAEQHLKQGLDANPTNRRLQYRLAVALAQQGRVTEAEPLFVQAVGEAEADYNIGLILYEHGETVLAEQRLLGALIKKPTLNQAHHWLEVVRNERAATNIASGQPPLPQPNGSKLPYGALNQIIDSQHADQVALGSLNLASRQALQQQQILEQSSLQVAPGPANVPPQAPTPSQIIQAPVQQYQTFDTSRMTATQLEQLQNSMTPEQRLAFQRQLQAGQMPLR